MEDADFDGVFGDRRTQAGESQTGHQGEGHGFQELHVFLCVLFMGEMYRKQGCCTAKRGWRGRSASRMVTDNEPTGESKSEPARSRLILTFSATYHSWLRAPPDETGGAAINPKKT